MKNTIIGCVIGTGVGFAVDRMFSKKKTDTYNSGDTLDGKVESILHPRGSDDNQPEFDFEFPVELYEQLALFKVYFGEATASELDTHVKNLLSKPKTCMTLTQKSNRIIETVREKYKIKALLSELDMSSLNEYDRLKATELIETLNDTFDDALNNYISDIQLALT